MEPDKKKCNSPYHVGERWLPLNRKYFYTMGKGAKGQVRWSPICKECDKARKRDRYHNKGEKRDWKYKNAYERARKRALVRLANHVPELYDRILVEELEKEGVPYKPKYDTRHYKSITIDP